MKMKKGIFLSLLVSSAFASDYQVHVLKEGETISGLLQSQGRAPLYGEDSWVKKTLEMNHLQSADAKEIKKGFPIILPKDRNAYIPTKREVQFTRNNFQETSNRKIKRSFFNTVSNHQDIIFNFKYGQRSIHLPYERVKMPENYTLGLKVQGKNNHKAQNFTYNFDGEIEAQSHGVGKLQDQQNSNVTMVPTYKLRTGVSIRHKNIPFNFGPILELEESTSITSTLTQTDVEIATRRDQTAFIGFKIQKSFKSLGYLHHFTANSLKSVSQNTQEGLSEFEKLQTNIEIKTNLTENYMAGLYYDVVSFDQIELYNEQTVGIQFSYKIK